MKLTLRKTVGVAAALGMLAGLTGIAKADTIRLDGDTLATGNNVTVSGTKCAAQSQSSGLATLNFQGSQHFKNNENVIVSSVADAAGDAQGITVTAGETRQLTSWDTTDDSAGFSIGASVPVTALDGTYTVTVKAEGIRTVSEGPDTGTDIPYEVSNTYTITVNCGRVAPPSDTTPPTVTITKMTGTGTTLEDTSSPFAVFTNNGSTITWSANEGGSYAIKKGGTGCGDADAVTGTNVSGNYATGNVESTVATAALVEGANTIRVCVTDAANNTGSATAAISKDTGVPTSTVGGFTDGAYLFVAPTVTCTADDGTGSGVAGHGTSTGGGVSLGLHTITCNGATDNAGNAQTDASAPKTYTMVALGGFNGNFDQSSVLVAKAGSVIPLRWAVTDGTNNVDIVVSIKVVYGATGTCNTDPSPDVAETAPVTNDPGASGFQKLPDLSYQWNWKSVKGETGCKRVTVYMYDAGGTILTARTATVNFTK